MDLQRLMLAFTLHMVREVLGADAVFTPEEIRFLHENFPEDLLVDCGFLSDSGHTTDAFEADRNLALVELPDMLTLDEKLTLIELLLRASAADTILQQEEQQVLYDAADALGVSRVVLDEQITQWLLAGRITMDEDSPAPSD